MTQDKLFGLYVYDNTMEQWERLTIDSYDNCQAIARGLDLPFDWMMISDNDDVAYNSPHPIGSRGHRRNNYTLH